MKALRVALIVLGIVMLLGSVVDLPPSLQVFLIFGGFLSLGAGFSEFEILRLKC